MKKQIIIIWWWVDYTNYNDYKDFIEKFEIDPYIIKEKWWKDNMQNNLWENFEIIRIDMPNKWFANYSYWKIFFEKYTKFFKDDIILIWHSLWWTFIIKYLNENIFSNKIRSIHLVAPASKDTEEELLWSFKFNLKLEKFKKYGEIINFYFSRDDEVVPFTEYDYFRDIMKNSKYYIFEDKWHFWTDKWVYNFEELLNNIKN